MFNQTRYQTGETDDIIKEMNNRKIPCVDVDDNDELNWFIGKLAENGIFKVEDIPHDKYARDRVKEPEFEFRIAFSNNIGNIDESENKSLMYIDFYFQPFDDRTYDTIGEM
ncbi:MAG: hypothetical protein Q8920_04790 [Bacillota bacterium]|nr:hypothetical protein [Bacillota bacterium]